jgi:YD repeat-containing protein
MYSLFPTHLAYSMCKKLFILLFIAVRLPLMAQEEKGWPFPDAALRKQHGIKSIGIWAIDPMDTAAKPTVGECLQYDQQGRLIHAWHYDGNGQPPREDLLFYDRQGRVVKMMWRYPNKDSFVSWRNYNDDARTCIETYNLPGYDHISKKYYYDKKGRLLREEKLDADVLTWVRTITYRNGRVHAEYYLVRNDTAGATRLKYHYTPSGLLFWKEQVGRSVTNQGYPMHYYDEDNRLVSTLSVLGNDTSLMRQYWQDGLPVRQMYSRSRQEVIHETDVRYSPAGLPVTLLHRALNPGQEKLFFEYHYDDAGRPVRKTFHNKNGPGYYLEYGYDANGRLVREARQQVGDKEPLQATLYTYDSTGRVHTTGVIRKGVLDDDYGGRRSLRPRVVGWDTVTTRHEYKNGKRHLEYSNRNNADTDCWLQYGRRHYPNVVLEEFRKDVDRFNTTTHCGYFLKIIDTIGSESEQGLTIVKLKIGVCQEINYNDSLPKTYRWRTLWLRQGQLQRLEDRDSAGLLLTSLTSHDGRYNIAELTAIWQQQAQLEIKTQIVNPLVSFAADSMQYDEAGRVLRHIQYFGPSWPGVKAYSVDSVFAYRNGLLYECKWGNSQGYRQVQRYEYDTDGRLLHINRFGLPGERYEYRKGRLHRVYTGQPETVTKQRVEYTFFDAGE